MEDIIMKVRDLLNQKGSEIYSIDSNSTVYNAIKKMSDLGIGALLVIDDDRLTGIISERDYRDKVILKGRQSKNTPVKDIMTDQVYTVNSEDDIKLCMRMMTDRKIRHLPVMDDDKLRGVISIGDVVKTIIDRQKGEIDSLRNYIAGGRYPG
ncbi:MAG: CBS domain-containing protein [Balneolaceae bacterium]|nr:CBS domain-containing protein [Balneolaceae bacterium]